jgi:hypothetical protein
MHRSRLPASSWKRDIAVIALVLQFSISAAEFGFAPSPVNAAGSNTTTGAGPKYSGVGEDYELALSYETVPSNLTQAWITFYTNSTFQAMETKLGWNVIKLTFSFSAVDASDQILNVANFANLNLAISIAAKYGFKVILNDEEYAPGFYGTSSWYADWNATAKNYKGNTNILMFDVANEMAKTDSGTNNDGCGSPGTAAIVCLDKVTDDIRQIDPTRAIAWWEYSLPDFPTVPTASELRSDVYLYVHAADYNLNQTTRAFLSCFDVTKFDTMINSLTTFSSKSGMPVIVDEFNTAYSQCNPTGAAEADYMIQSKVPWVANNAEYQSLSDILVPLMESMPPVHLSLTLGSTSVAPGAKVTFSTSGWNPGEELLLKVLVSTTGQYVNVWKGTASSSGSASGSFTATTSLVGKDSVYMIDPTTPFPHTSTGWMKLTVT